MREEPPGQSAEQVIEAAYSDPRQREHAVRWLGWIAYRMGTGTHLNWWDIPAWIPGRQLAAARWFAVWAVFGVVDVVTAVMAPLMAYWFVFFQIMISVQAARDKRSAPIRVRSVPQAIVPRGLRRREIGALVFWALLLVFPVIPFLIRLWRCPAADKPGATAVGAYRADRRTHVIMALALTPVAALIGVPAWILLSASSQGLVVRLAVVAIFAIGMAVFLVLMRAGQYPLLKLAELVLSVRCRERVSFLSLVETAVTKEILLHSGATGYRFQDDGMHAYLAMLGDRAHASHTRDRARRLARAGIRSKVAAALSGAAAGRFSWDVGAGAGIAAAVTAWAATGPANIRTVLGGFFLGGLAGFAVARLLRAAAAGVRWAMENLPDASRKAHVVTAVAAAAAAVFVVAETGTILAKATAAVLPAVFVAACGAWGYALTFRKVRAMSGRWLMLSAYAPDVIVAATTAAGLGVLVDRHVLTTLAASGLLFPVGVWGSVASWRTMDNSERLVVKAGADIAFSVLLGAQAVLFLVWLANLLGLPRAEVIVLRAVLGRAGNVLNFPWWVWTGIYALLAATGLAFARWPVQLKAPIRWSERLHLIPAVKATRRVLTGVYIALLMIVLVGMAAPAAMAPTLQRHIKAAYTVAFQRHLQAEGEIAAYTEIQRQSVGSASARPLTTLIIDIHEISSPSPGDDQATATETDLASRLGELQAATLALSPQAAESSATAEARLSDPLHDAADLGHRLAEESKEEKDDDTASKRVEEAGELAAAAVANLISLPNISSNEVFQIVREYLSGLIEGSQLKDVFAAWAEHVTHKTPPDADDLVEPDPAQLEQAADDALPPDIMLDRAAARALSEPPLMAAADMANQARYFQEHVGPCTGCAAPDTPDQPGGPPEDGPAEP
jgi:hypothetical protein